MPLTARILDMHTHELDEEHMPDDGLDEFLNHPSCALRRNGTCELSGSHYCERLCPHGNAGGPG